jgi:hypothetical protein
LPNYFELINISASVIKHHAIKNWVAENTTGRFFLGSVIGIVQRKQHTQIEPVLTIAFENPKELSYFILACPHL